ncbi:VOC family protein [Crystallibacter degradans]|uniref:VOC family protein n=1 Tax=Crystallibacter degradans TaxID=2726743 RepID=UPI00147474CD|nr:VOC family protein [Arthrobacter sp. SF27]NMR30536.1 hypothetical protein [Arthrobacter sp. SF27]
MCSVSSIFHTGITVTNLEKSIQFYTEGLGLELRHRQTQDNAYTRSLVGYPNALLHIAQLRFPGERQPPSGHHIELVEYERPKGETGAVPHNHAGTMHLAFAVDGIHQIAERLVQLGGRLISEPVPITAGINNGGYALYLHDPDGVVLELLQQPVK